MIIVFVDYDDNNNNSTNNKINSNDDTTAISTTTNDDDEDDYDIIFSLIIMIEYFKDIENNEIDNDNERTLIQNNKERR